MSIPCATSACSAPGIRFSIANESPSRARKIKPTADADGHLDRLEPDPEREPLRIGHAVGHERQRDRGLHETDVPGPERKEHRHVHQHEHEPRRGERHMDVERAHRCPDREQLAGPAGALKQGGLDGGHGGAHDAEAVPGHRDEAPHAPGLLEHRAMMAPRARKCEREDPETDDDEDQQARQRPVRDLRGREHVPDQQERREEVEDPVCEDGADERRPRVAAPSPFLVAGQHRDARQLPDSARQHGICEETHSEGGEDLAEGRGRRRHRLLDHALPGGRPRHDGDEIEGNRGHHPLPGDEPEGVGDEVPLRAAPDEEPDHHSERRQDQRQPPPRRPEEPHAATAFREPARSS